MTEWNSGSSAGNLDTFTLVYEEPKYSHECAHCGYEANLYESIVEYECPVCRKGTLCRVAHNIIFPVNTAGPWTTGWQGYEPTTASVFSQPMEDGYLFVRR